MSQTEECPPTWIDDPAARLARKNAFDASLVYGAANFNQTTGRLSSKSRPFLWAIDQVTGLVRSDLTQARRCPVCDTPPECGLFVKDGFRHVKCQVCGLIYVSLVLRGDVMDKYWREERAWSAVLNSAPQMDLDRLKYLYGLELAAARLAGRRLLDVGSGAGGFVRLAEENGWQSTALELNVTNSQLLAEQGFQVIVKHLELSDLPPRSFDLISFWEVLEHLPDPRAVLSEARRLLAPNGLILILVPNAGSLVTRLLHDKSNTFGGHSHLNHFNLESLTRLLNSAQLTVLDQETVITELGAINNYLGLEDPYSGRAAAFWEELTPELIHQKLWGSRLLMLAGRNSNEAVSV